MTYTEQLLEAISYASDNDSNWWEAFESIEDAKNVLRGARKEIPEEVEVTMLLSLLDQDGEFYDLDTPQGAYKRCLRMLTRQIESIT